MYSLLRSYGACLSLAGRHSVLPMAAGVHEAFVSWTNRMAVLMRRCPQPKIPDPHETIMLCGCSLKPRGARALEGVVSCSLRTVREGGTAGSTWALILFSMQLRQ